MSVTPAFLMVVLATLALAVGPPVAAQQGAFVGNGQPCSINDPMGCREGYCAPAPSRDWNTTSLGVCTARDRDCGAYGTDGGFVGEQRVIDGELMTCRQSRDRDIPTQFVALPTEPRLGVPSLGLGGSGALAAPLGTPSDDLPGAGWDPLPTSPLLNANRERLRPLDPDCLPNDRSGCDQEQRLR